MEFKLTTIYCFGVNCTKKESCYRYNKITDAQSQSIHITFFSKTPYDSSSKSCHDYWPVKESKCCAECNAYIVPSGHNTIPYKLENLCLEKCK